MHEWPCSEAVPVIQSLIAGWLEWPGDEADAQGLVLYVQGYIHNFGFVYERFGSSTNLQNHLKFPINFE